MTDNFYDNWPKKWEVWDPAPEVEPLDLNGEHNAKVQAALALVEPTTAAEKFKAGIAEFEARDEAEEEAKHQAACKQLRDHEAKKRKADKPKTQWMDEAIIAFITDGHELLPPDFWEATVYNSDLSPFDDEGLCGTAYHVIVDYHAKTGQVPSREALCDSLAKELTVEDTFKVDALERIRKYRLDPRNTPLVQASLVAWINERMAQKRKGATVSAISKQLVLMIDSLGDPNYNVALRLQMGELSKSLAPPTKEVYTLAELVATFPHLHPAVVDGLVRQGEIANVVSSSKVGKSWLVYSLALCLVTGKPWLGKYETTPGKVLLVDNELHGPTLAHRIPKVANALDIRFEEYKDKLEVWTLRDNPRSLSALRDKFMSMTPGEYGLIILDAKYRFAEQGGDENSNTSETHVYNLLNEYAASTKAAFVLVHHSTKGDQSEKRVTDVGSGAGAQSRAADTHLVLREHKDAGQIVLDAVARSFPPVESLVLRWDFPLWVPDEAADPTQLATATNRKQDADNEAGMQSVLAVLRKQPEEWLAVNTLAPKAKMGHERTKKLLFMLLEAGEVEERATKANNKGLVYKISPPPTRRRDNSGRRAGSVHPPSPP